MAGKIIKNGIEYGGGGNTWTLAGQYKNTSVTATASVIQSRIDSCNITIPSGAIFVAFQFYIYGIQTSTNEGFAVTYDGVIPTCIKGEDMTYLNNNPFVFVFEYERNSARDLRVQVQINNNQIYVENIVKQDGTVIYSRSTGVSALGIKEVNKIQFNAWYV